MPKGIDQVVEAARLCGEASSGLSGDGISGLRVRVEAIAERLESLRTKFFLRMGPAVRYTAVCLEAAQSLQAAVAAGETADALVGKIEALEAATATLDDRANAAGNMTIT